MDNIIDLYYKNCSNRDEFEIIFNSNTYEKTKIPIHKSGLFFQKNNDLKIYKNKENIKTTATSYSDFNRLISVLNNNGFILQNEKYILSIGLNKNRIRITNLDGIKEYCNTGNLPNYNIEYIEKKTKKINGMIVKNHFNNKYNFRINYKTENPLSDMGIDLLKKDFKESYKTFRYIKRFILTNEKFPYLKIDCSIVKSKTKFKTLKESNIFKSNANYEIEMELINDKIIEFKNSTTDFNSKKNEIKNIVKLIFSTLQNTIYPIDNMKKHYIIKKYHSLASNNISSNNYRRGCLNDNKSFFGPGSVALQREHLHEDTNNTILKNYCVTDKADGERKFIYITDDNEYNVYLIDINMKIQFTGLTVSQKNLKNTIIDGEHILYETSNFKNIFLAFDIYYLNHKKTTDLIFYSERDIPTRYKHLVKTIDSIKENVVKINKENDLKIECKHFYFCNREKDIFNCCKDIFNYITSNKVEYNTDGLIFTPIHLKLKQESKKEKYDLNEIKKKTRWNSCYKWKEPRDNTIDFLIKVKKTKQHKNYKTVNSGFKTKENVVELYVGDYIMDYKMAFWKNDPNIKKIYDKTLFNPSTYNDDGLASYSIIKEENYNSILGMYTEVDEKGKREYIEDDTIVEFRYGTHGDEKSGEKRWIPIRVRHNKTLQYKNQNSNFGNNIKTALSNWRSINESVTKEVLTGKITIGKLEQIDYEKTLNQGAKKDKKVNAYWNPTIVGKRNKLKYTKNLRVFHNQIKYELIKYCSNKLGKMNTNKSIFDMTCGKGGDLMKWINNGYKHIVGFDKYQDSITNNEDGIYKRAYSQKNDNKFPIMIFEQADAGKNYIRGEAFNGSEIEKNNIGHDIIKCVLGQQYDHGLVKVLEKFEGVAKRGFDVISNQFSIHYFFKDIETLTGFVQNISECCKNNGYFIGTCFDGKKIYELLKERPNISRKVDGHKVFEIERIYDPELDRYNTFLNNNMSSLGYPIDVYMESIGVKAREYLVNFDYFISIMKHYGFTLENIDRHPIFKNGSNLFDKLNNISYKKNNIYDKLTGLEKEISFNNRYFIFKKTINIQHGDPANVTRQLRANRILDGDLLEMVDGGYDINLFSNKNRRKDNNFNGLPQIFNKTMPGKYDHKLKNYILKSRNVLMVELTKDNIINNFNEIQRIYEGIDKNTFLILNFEKLPKNTYILDEIEDKLLNNEDIIYYGIISKNVNGFYFPFLIFKKGVKITFKQQEIDEFNKIIVPNKSEKLYDDAAIKGEIIKKKYNFSVFNDCPLIGGTKQRALVPFISRLVENKIVYAGPSIGFAQIALAKALSILYNNDSTKPKKQLILYFNGSNLNIKKHFDITKKIVEIYDNIVINIFCSVNDVSKFNRMLMNNLKSNERFRIIPEEKKLKEIQKYVTRQHGDSNSYVVPFGLRFPGFVNLLSKQIIKALPNFDRNREDIRIWLVAGSGAILNSLYKVFPNAEFVIVEVGHTIFDDVMELKRTTKFIYSKIIKHKKKGNLFNEDAKDIWDMPYYSVNNYDAKVWPVFKIKYQELQSSKGEKENFIWNVACIKTFNEYIQQNMSEKEIVEKKKIDNTFKVLLTPKTIVIPN